MDKELESRHMSMILVANKCESGMSVSSGNVNAQSFVTSKSGGIFEEGNTTLKEMEALGCACFFLVPSMRILAKVLEASLQYLLSKAKGHKLLYKIRFFA